ncbi:unnamed protein product [Tilletia controversa]|nr:unnamed protein product [Tilletia controversa]
MQNDTEFQKQYLAFFDSIIHHHIPPANVVDQAIPTDAEPTRFPRQECPPDPDAPDFPFVFEADHRLLGDDVQRHSCRTTCFKGGRTSCRFLFPHELNPTSHYDIETNSINLRIKDPVINWHNPALLVATRHNHDLKSVQSGRSGLAAASYITSYATKSEETPANQISMIQTVLERMASLGQDATELRGLLSRCVMQFGRERQVHAQQAATYVRDLGDTYQSHNTIAMLSGRMMLTVVKLYGAPRKDSGADSEPSDPPSISTELSTTTNAPAPVAMGETDATSQETIASTAAAEDEVDRVDENDDDDSDDDDELLPLSATGDAHQVDDYFHRGDSLQHLSFYDFVRFCKLIKVPRKANKNHHALGDSHPNIGKRSHRYNPDRQQGITRAIFSTMPRSNGTEGHGDSYCASMLSHFKPFGIDSPLKTKDVTYEEAFRQTNFSDDAKRVMDNWMALTECDDARDAEQLLRRKREACRDHHQDEAAAAMAAGEGTPGDSATADVDIAAAAAAMAAGEGTPGDSATADVDIAALMNRSDKMSAQTLLLMANLASSHWFDANKPANSSTVNPDSSQHQPPPFIPTFTAAVKRKWTAQLAEIEAQMKATATAPRATTGALAESLGFGVAAPATTQEEEFVGPPRPIPALPTTVSNNKKSSPPDELIRTLIQERNLTASQALAFKVAARHFFTELTGQCTSISMHSYTF